MLAWKEYYMTIDGQRLYVQAETDTDEEGYISEVGFMDVMDEDGNEITDNELCELIETRMIGGLDDGRIIKEKV